MYHVLSKDSFISSGVNNFEKQMKLLLYDENWKTITSEEFYLFKKKRLKLPKKICIDYFWWWVINQEPSDEEYYCTIWYLDTHGIYRQPVVFAE